MVLGKTMSALARMIMYTRNQLVEFELKLISMDENRQHSKVIQTALLAIRKAASKLWKHWSHSLIYTTLTPLIRADAFILHETQRSNAMGLDTGT